MSKPITRDDLPVCKGLLCLIAYDRIPPCSIFDSEKYTVREPSKITGITKIYYYRNHYFECYETNIKK